MTEILAPVGSVQALKAAVYSGANAVYLGLDLFNARIKADNFTIDNIGQYVDFCHLFGVKVFVTFNTNIKENELAQFELYADACAKADVDAFIVTDFGVLDILKKYDIPLHASTQIGAHNLAGAKVLEKLGFSRVILAREALESDIIAIKQNTKLEIEYFVHGALCVSFSGGCLLSSMMSGDSGNRGKCNQPCRLEYKSSFNSKPSYLLSPADQCLIGKLDRLIAYGVDSLKIEGRLKQAHYVGVVVEQYRKFLETREVTQHMTQNLQRAYNRGNFSEGYNYCATSQIMFPSIQGNIGQKIGTVAICKDNNVHIRTNYPLKVGDGLKIVADNKELGGFGVTKLAYKGGETLVESNKTFPQGSEVRITLDSAQVSKFENVNPKKRLRINCVAKLGKSLEIEFSCDGVAKKFVGNIVEKAEKMSTDISSIRKQLSKVGESNFAVVDESDIVISADDGIFVPLSLLNGARRDTLQLLEQELLARNAKKKSRVNYSQFCNQLTCRDNYICNNKPFVATNNIDIIADNNFLENVNLVIDFDENCDEFFESILQNSLICKSFDDKIINAYAKLPKIARGKDIEMIKNFLEKYSNRLSGIICDNIYAIEFAREYGLVAIGGQGLNLYNERAAQVLGLDNYLSSVELTLDEQSNMRKNHIVYSYGELTVMTLCHCPIQLNTKCSCATCKYQGDFFYYDKMAKYRICRTKLKNCYFNVKNPQKIDIRNKISKVRYNYFVELGDCDKLKADEIVQNFVEKVGKSEENTTCGHLFRGVK
ncbi:MAG: U32 family peptidase [Clostridia bacterium]